MNRRQFLSYSAAALAAGAMTPASADATQRFGLQLFSIPKMLEKNFREGIAFVAGLGYSEVEFYGPYSFSAPEAIAGWRSVTPQLGFSGSGFFGLAAAQVHSILSEHRLAAPSMHTDLLTLQQGMGALAEAAHVLGATYVTLPSIPATWPSQPMPNCAAGTRTSRSSPCAPPNQPPSPIPTAPS